MDLTIRCKKLEVDGYDNSGNQICVTLETIDSYALDTEEVAKQVEIGTFLDAHGEDVVMEYLKKNYEWED